MKLYFKYAGMLLKSQMQYKASFIHPRRGGGGAGKGAAGPAGGPVRRGLPRQL